MAASKGTPGAQGERNPLRMVLFILSIGLCLFGFYSILDFQSSVQAQLSGELILGQVDSASYNHKDAPVLGFLFEYFGVLTYLFALMIVYLGYFLVLKPVDIWHADFYKACLRLLGFNLLLIGLAGVLSRVADLGTTGAGGLLGDMLNMFFDLALPGLLSVFIFALTAFCGVSMLMGRNPFFLFDRLGEVFFKVLPARSRNKNSESRQEPEGQAQLAALTDDSEGVNGRALAAGAAGTALAAGALASEAKAAEGQADGAAGAEGLSGAANGFALPSEGMMNDAALAAQSMENQVISLDDPADSLPAASDSSMVSQPEINGDLSSAMSLQQTMDPADPAFPAADHAHELRLPDDAVDLTGAGFNGADLSADQGIYDTHGMGAGAANNDLPEHINNMDDAFLQAAAQVAREQEMEEQGNQPDDGTDFFSSVINGEHGRMSPDLQPDYSAQDQQGMPEALGQSIQDAAALEHQALNSSDPELASDFFSDPIVSDAEQAMRGGMDALDGDQSLGTVSPMPDLNNAPAGNFYDSATGEAMQESMTGRPEASMAGGPEGRMARGLEDRMAGRPEDSYARGSMDSEQGSDPYRDQHGFADVTINGRAADSSVDGAAADSYADFTPEAGAPDTLGADQGGIQGIAADDSFASWQDDAAVQAAASSLPEQGRAAAQLSAVADDKLPGAGEFFDEAANAAADSSEGMTSDSSVAAARSAISAAAAAAAGRAAAAGFTGAAGAMAAAAQGAVSTGSGQVMALSAAADHFRDRRAGSPDTDYTYSAADDSSGGAERRAEDERMTAHKSEQERAEAERQERAEAERQEQAEAERQEREAAEREAQEREAAERAAQEAAESERRAVQEAATAAAAEAEAAAAAEAEAAATPEGADENSPYGYGTYAATHKLRREREEPAPAEAGESSDAREAVEEDKPGAVHTIVQRTDPEVFAAQQEARRKEREEAERREREEAERREREEAERREREEAERREREEAERREREEAERREREEAERLSSDSQQQSADDASMVDESSQTADSAQDSADGDADDAQNADEEEAPIYAGTYAAKLARERAAQAARDGRSGRKNKAKADDEAHAAQEDDEHKEDKGPSTIIRDTRREFEEAQAARAAQARAAKEASGTGDEASDAAADAAGSVEVNMFGSDSDADSSYEPRHAYDFGSGQKAGQLDESLSGTSSADDSDDEDGYFAGAAMHEHSEDCSDDSDEEENIIAFDSIGKEDSGYEVGALTSAFIPVPDDNHAPVRQTPVRSGPASAASEERQTRNERVTHEAAHVAQEEKSQTADSAGNTYTTAESGHDDLASWAGAVASALDSGSPVIENHQDSAAHMSTAQPDNMEPAGQFVPVPEGQTLAGAQGAFGNNGQPVQYMQLPNGQVVPVMPGTVNPAMPGTVNPAMNGMPAMGQYLQLPNGQVMPFMPGNMNQGMMYQGQLNGMMNPAMANGMMAAQNMQAQQGFNGMMGAGMQAQGTQPGAYNAFNQSALMSGAAAPAAGEAASAAAGAAGASAGAGTGSAVPGMPEAGNNFMGAHNSSSSTLPSYMAGVAQEHSSVSEPRGSRVLCTVPRRRYDEWRPSIDLLARSNSHVSEDMEELDQRAELINEVLQSFGVKATVADYITGPVITRFDLDLAPGVKTSAISSIETELCRNLMVPNIRVVPIIDGSSYVGLEVPNSVRRFITLADMAESREFQETTSQLPLCLGASVVGSPVVKDLAEAPHLLVAGTTGSGKSAVLNTMLISLLLKCSPAELRLILVDPKQLEFSIYKDLPHLITPVITDVAEKTPVALNWCVDEMERRFKLMSLLGVRKLSEYNDMVKREAQAGRSIPDPLWTVDQGPHPQALEPLPCIVVVVEEFADLMAQSGRRKDKEGTPEGLIARLSAKARAAGIHLVLVTQTPRSEVVTGTIKANFPSRVALTVQNRLDSTIVLDEKGAETLLGNGDMLYKFTGSSTATRAHGSFTSNDDVRAIVDAWREHAGAPEYLEDVIYVPEEVTEDPGEAKARELDVKFDAAAALAREYLEMRGKPPTVSDLQTELGVGFPRAKKIHMQLMREGVFN